MLLLAVSSSWMPFAEGGEGKVSFNRDIRPILSDRCFHCHGPDEEDRKADLRLDVLDSDGSTLAALSPGNVAESELIRRISSKEIDVVMPPPEAHKKAFSESEIEVFENWIEQGAPYEKFWAFTPVVRPAIPDVENPEWCSNAIDHFILRKLEENQVAPQEVADRRTLLRRLSLDLTGLPPTREEIGDFLEDESDSAYEDAVDRLLNKPQFGEHQARYWLDLVRFADTNGIHHDHYRDLSPYRQWVIQAFNEGLPYDDFVRFQIAGDLFPDATDDQLIASGFNRLHMIIDRGTMLPEESLARNVIDRVTAVGTAFMGLTVGCAVCHDHKYDPITSKDFYQLYAFFNNLDASAETGGRSGNDFKRGLQPPYIELPSAEQEKFRLEISERRAELNRQIESIKNTLKTLDAAEAGTNEDQARETQLAREEGEAELKQLEDQSKQLRAENDALDLLIPAAMVMRERQEKRPAYLMIRGAYDNLGAQVQRGTPAFLPSLKRVSDGPADRMDLATWLVAPEQPLTARVAVNRFWQQLFGVGIVRTSEDLGAQGEWPSHPDLLDYLASGFIDSGWNVRSLFKQMVMSKAYRQRSDAGPEAFKRDPDNRLIARGSRYRLDAEVIRDQFLYASGLMNAEIGGKSVKPPQPLGLWKSVALPSSYPNQFVADEGDKVYRRSVYTFWKRGMPPPQMTILNAPTREDCTARRERTNTPLQALLLMNETQCMEAARQLAIKSLEVEKEKRIAFLYETITGRVPDESEMNQLVSATEYFESFYRSNPDLAIQLNQNVANVSHESHEVAAWTMLVNTLFNLDITKTRS